eukprot:718584-Amphidinium_carterae.1
MQDVDRKKLHFFGGKSWEVFVPMLLKFSTLHIAKAVAGVEGEMLPTVDPLKERSDGTKSPI